MKVKKTFLFGTLVSGFIGLATVAGFSGTKVAAEEGDPVVHDCITEFGAWNADKVDCSAFEGTPWCWEALNTYEFVEQDLGATLADSNGYLPTGASFGDSWPLARYSLQTYPLWTNASMVEEGVKRWNQYPQGWRMSAEANYTEQDCGWPTDGSKCTGGTQYLNIWEDGRIHPGTGAGLVAYFTVPEDGTVYAKDSILVDSEYSDGIYTCVYHIPAANFYTCGWNVTSVHGLFGGRPVYPTEGVNPTKGWGTGWKHAEATKRLDYETYNFEVKAGDAIAFVYGEGPSNSSDLTHVQPQVIYGKSPADPLYGDVHDWATEFGNTYGKKEDGLCYGYEPWSVEVLNTAEFIKDGGGASLHDDNGKLATFQDWKNPDDYSLLSYPCWTNSSMVEEDGLHRYNQYPQGWRMTGEGDYASIDNCWPSDGSKCSASTAYLNTYADGRIHPGTGAGQVLYFKAPKTGTAYIQDTISVQEGGDGINVVVYHIPAAEVILQTWNSQVVHGLYNATPIFPEAGVNPVGYETGWFHVDSGATREYISDTFTLSEGDILAFVYGCGANNACDMTQTSPNVVYGQHTYSELTGMQEEFGNKTDCPANGDPWTWEALNIASFTQDGLGATLADEETGKLPTNASYGGDWPDARYSLQTYAMWTNPSMVDDGVKYFNQFPQGWRMTGESDYAQYDTPWPNDGSKCTGSTAYMRACLDGHKHPGTGVGIVSYFKCPKAGSVYVTDTITVQDDSWDGVYFSIYKIDAADYFTGSWSGEPQHGLFGAKPVWPEAGVQVSADYTTGWFHVNGGKTTSYYTPDIEVAEGDVLAIIFAPGNNNGCDMTYTSPTVSYKKSPLPTIQANLAQAKEAAIAEVANYVDAANYRTEQQSIISTIIDEANAAINAAYDVEDVEAAVAAAKAALDKVPTSANLDEQEAAALADAKDLAKQAIDSYKNADDYTTEQQAVLAQAIADAKDAIDAATSIEEVSQILEEQKGILDAIPTGHEAPESSEPEESSEEPVESSEEPVESSEEPTPSSEEPVVESSEEPVVESSETPVESSEEATSSETVIPDVSKGCGGSVLAASGLITIISLAGVVLFKSRKED